MKKLLTLVAILPAVSLSVPCFGVLEIGSILLHTVLAILVIVSVITTQTA